MSALTADRDTIRRSGDEFVFEVAASTTIYAGAMVCLNASGKAVPASVTASLTPVVGVAQHKAIGGETLSVRRGVFRFAAKSGDAPALANVGSTVYADDDQTVKKTVGSSPASPSAGIVVDVDSAGVWIKL